MMVEVFMPKLGLTMREGTVVQWLKAEGEFVSKGEVLLEISTEKITNSIEAPVGGTLAKILVPEGEVAPVGAVVALLAASAEDAVPPDQAEPVLGDREGGASPAEEADKVIAKAIPLAGVRKAIADRMEESLRKSPQATLTTRVDMSALLALKNDLASRGKQVSQTALLVKATAAALAEHPLLNVSIQEGKIVFYESINIGVAVAADDLLYVPVIKNADQKSVTEIAERIKVFAEQAKAGKLSAKDLSGGTFTLSNMGMYDVDVMTPIINLPEAAILAVGTVRKELVVDGDGTTQIKPMAYLSLTIDHAATDGVPAARFLQTLKQILANPSPCLDH